MKLPIPSVAEVRAQLEGVDTAQLKRLAVRADVPFTTLWKIRSGETGNPGIETVRKFWPVINEAAGDVAAVRRAA